MAVTVCHGTIPHQFANQQNVAQRADRPYRRAGVYYMCKNSNDSSPARPDKPTQSLTVSATGGERPSSPLRDSQRVDH